MNDINELREHLFAALKGLRDEKNPMDVKRAMAIANVAQAVIHSVKVEIDHQKLTGGKGSGFIPEQLETPKPGVPRLVRGKDMRG